MAGDQWSHISARFEEWWDETLVADPARSGPLVIVVAGQVEAATASDFSVAYDELPGSRYAVAEFSGERWRATRTDGTRLEGVRGSERELQEAGVAFLLDPRRVLEHSEVLGDDTQAGTRRLTVREPQASTVTTRSGHLVDFGKAQGVWRHIADDVSFRGADTYEAVQDVASGVLLRWDALCGSRILRRLQLVDVATSWD
jgi:hypothetical protein